MSNSLMYAPGAPIWPAVKRLAVLTTVSEDEKKTNRVMHAIDADDVLDIRIFEEKELSGYYRVSGDGTILGEGRSTTKYLV